jgi:cytochrome c55X
MRRILFLALASLAWASPAAGDPAPARQQELMSLLLQDCGSCHGMTMKGGLGPSLLPKAIADKSDDGLVDTILLGRPGTPMPPWDFEITRDEAYWLIRQLRSGKAEK